MIPKKRKPSHPGEILLEDFLKPIRLSQLTLSTRMGIPVQRINALIKGKRGLSAEMAVLLARVFNTTSRFWMNLQTNLDIYKAEQKLAD